MKSILVIPDSFKGCMTSERVAEIISDVIESKTEYKAISIPIADGGEGSTDCMLKVLGGEKISVPVHSPTGNIIMASYGITDSLEDRAAIIEIAEPCGITKQEGLHPTDSNTLGFGEMIRDALDRGIRRFFLCLGGSATTDCGLGMAAALGAEFWDSVGYRFIPTGGTMKDVAGVDLSGLDPRIRESSFICMSDVTNPLYGPSGAAHVFSPQKGATKAEVRLLDKGLLHISKILDFAGLIPCEAVIGAGAAGGAGYGCAAFLDATITSGINAMLDICNFDSLVDDAAMIITGEGKLDSQSTMGKVVGGIRQRAKGKPIVVFTGICELSQRELNSMNVTCIEIGRGIPLEESFRDAPENLRKQAEKYFEQLNA